MLILSPKFNNLSLYVKKIQGLLTHLQKNAQKHTLNRQNQLKTYKELKTK